MKQMNDGEAEEVASALAFDRAHLWHPYTSMRDPLPVQPVVAAHGTRLVLADGRELIDGMSSWWAAIHGYGVPELERAATEQFARMPHVMFGGLTHAPAVELGRRLVEITPPGLERVFFCDSGSVAVEVAIKMALQYWASRDDGRRCRLLTVRGGYYGDTFGAMAVCDPIGGMHSLFSGVLPRHLFAERPRCRFDAPWDPSALDDVRDLLRDHAPEIAAIIVEPVVQGAGGMWFYHPRFLVGLRELCDESGTLLIFDEIATGFGRTGLMFAAEHAGVSPDILCLGKALTGGTMTLAATLTRARVADGISEGRHGELMHGPTFMANPLACAVACASIDLLQAGPWQERVAALEVGLERGLAPARQLPAVADVRVLGGIGVVEMREPVDAVAAQRHFVERGVWVRPFGRLIYLMPPYITPAAEVEQLCRAVVELAAAAGA